MKDEGTPFTVLRKYLKIILRIQLLHKGIRGIIGDDMDNKIIITKII